MTAYHPATIVAVTPGSAAARAGIRPGDHLLALNGQPVRDVIDVQIYAAEPELVFTLERDGRRVQRTIQRRYGQPLGLEFTEELFDGPLHVCRNACDFCFVAQMPPGLRPSLYVKDDDYRLSFLHGNYVTLTNLAEQDWTRIAEQFLSPLYISVHATEPEVRVGLLRNPRAGEILAQLTRLVEAGIELHTQAVLIPGRNDGEHLDRTIADLAALYPGVASLTVVPVGLTRERDPGLRPYTDAEAAAVLMQTLDWQRRLRAELGVGFVYPSDEWYIRTGRPVPPLAAYDGLHDALIENGVGMVRHFLDAWPERQAELATLGGPHQVWITGALFAPLLAECAAAFSQTTGIRAEVLPVPNRFFGETVTVAGLLTVEDILTALDETPSTAIIVAPNVIFRGPEGRSLDGHTPADLARRVYVVRET
ncbi:MAG TPA: DUF512 domain-containing protein [Chloroflexi bacterium]|nr:DUF512 domain-containing protein [Chloroflexota bacterium]